MSHEIPVADDGGAFYGVPQPSIAMPRHAQAFVPQIPAAHGAPAYPPAFGGQAPFVPGAQAQARLHTLFADFASVNFEEYPKCFHSLLDLTFCTGK